eukprot:4379036-Prymnesium_polylepis.1
MEAKWEEERVERARKFAEAGRVRVLEAKALDAKLDKQEEEVDAQERKDAKEAKAARLAQAQEMRKQHIAYNKVRAPRASERGRAHSPAAAAQATAAHASHAAGRARVRRVPLKCAKATAACSRTRASVRRSGGRNSRGSATRRLPS